MTGHRKILIVSYPGPGLISPSLRLANTLVKMGVAVTYSTSFSMIEKFDKKTIPQGLTLAPIYTDYEHYNKQPATTLQRTISDFATKGACAIAEVITSAAATCQPFDHLVYTTIIPWAATIANAYNLKSTLLWCQSATILDIYFYYFNFSCYQELISDNKNNPTFPINLPGLPPLSMADIPSFFLESSPKKHEFLIPLYKDHIDALKTEKTPRILINNFNELENESMSAFENIQFLPIGPLLDEKESFFGNPEDDYVVWLNTKPKNSVVYVSFGMISGLSSEQAEEMANGLLENGSPFLWVMRDVDEATKLSKIDEVKKQGMIVGWCHQVEVLSHQAIGCFVSHCGWNSTVEALAAGVAIVAYPQWTDQWTNAKMIEDVWKAGVRVARNEGNEMVEGKEIARCVRLVMEDEEISKNALKWKELAKKVVDNNGSSTLNLKAFLDDDV